jgi:hypothetical protein
MRKTSNEEGNVLVEFIGVIVALLVPISIIAGACISIAQSYLATDVSARAASRAFVVSSSEARARTNSKSAALVSLNDLDTASASVAISCSKTPCLTPGGYVTVKVSRKINLQLPMKLGARSILVSTQHTAVVDELREP